MRKIHLGVIYGSTREGRLCDKVGRWVVGEIEKQSAFAAEVIDPATFAIGHGDSSIQSASTATLRRRIAAADAFVVVTPEYNRSYPAPLKALIDSFSAEWRAKPVGFVSYGGISGGLRAVEHLRHVFTELHAVGIRDCVSFANAWERFDAEARLKDPEPAARAMVTMLARLSWWAIALRNAREQSAYLEAVA
jgi:NAD(P)H-dependent FMN reductase